MKLNPDFKELLVSFNGRNVRYLVVGAYAMALHKTPRFTGDIDLFVEPTPENARRVLEALRAFGFDSPDLTEADLVKPGQIIQLGRYPNRVDLITSISGLAFADAYGRCLRETVEDLVIPFPCLEDLIRNKEASGRDKDLLDVKLLRKRLGR